MPDPNVHTPNNAPARAREQRLRRTGLTALSAGSLAACLTASSGLAKPPAKGATSTTAAQNARANGGKAAQPTLAGDNTPLTQEQKILHILNRMGYGPRPGDVARVQAIGLHQYIEQQLNPDKINDSLVETKLAGLTLIKQPASEIAGAYAMRQNKTVKLLRAKQGKDAQKPEMMTSGEQTMTAAPAAPTMQERRARLASLSPDERDSVRQAMEAQQQIRQAGTQLALDKTVRAAESERQFQEVMTDFWSNHFNIDIRKNACAAYKISDERDAIRPHVFGTFRQLLGASAHSPAMMVYLDNAQSQAAQPDTPQTRRRQQMVQNLINRAAQNGNENAQTAQAALKNKGKGGINENYAREIMELHTLGVDGGYTQKDVQEVARCLTGWTVNRQQGSFVFTPRRHDTGGKTVLGQTIPAGGGEADGEKVLDILASHPSTMRFISTELCRRLVSDEPPASLVDKCVATWKTTDGDLRAIYRTIVTSPEFFSRAAYHQKVKSPFEYAVSSVRALGATFDLGTIEDGMPRYRLVAGKNGGKAANPNQGRTLAGQVGTMGQPLFQYQAPTGYSEDSRKWVSSGALISRLNFALSLVGNKLVDVQVPRPAATVTPTALVNQLAASLLNGEITPSTRATLLKQATMEPGNAAVAQTTDQTARLTALVLGSPEFQRR